MYVLECTNHQCCEPSLNAYRLAERYPLAWDIRVLKTEQKKAAISSPGGGNLQWRKEHTIHCYHSVECCVDINAANARKQPHSSKRKLHTQKQKNNDVYLFWHSTILWNRRFYAKMEATFSILGLQQLTWAPLDLKVRHISTIQSPVDSRCHFLEELFIYSCDLPQKESMEDEAETYFYFTSWPKSNVNSSFMYWEDTQPKNQPRVNGMDMT